MGIDMMSMNCSLYCRIGAGELEKKKKNHGILAAWQLPLMDK